MKQSAFFCLHRTGDLLIRGLNCPSELWLPWLSPMASATNRSGGDNYERLETKDKIGIDTLFDLLTVTSFLSTA